MAKKHPIETPLPEEYEKHRARFMGITVERIRLLRGHFAMMRNRWGGYQRERPPPSDEESHKPPVKRSSGTTMFPYDDSEIGQRRLKAAGERVAEVGRKAGLEAQKRIRLARLRAGLPVEPEDDPREER